MLKQMKQKIFKRKQGDFYILDLIKIDKLLILQDKIGIKNKIKESNSEIEIDDKYIFE